MSIPKSPAGGGFEELNNIQGGDVTPETLNFSSPSEGVVSQTPFTPPRFAQPKQQETQNPPVFTEKQSVPRQVSEEEFLNDDEIAQKKRQEVLRNLDPVSKESAKRLLEHLSSDESSEVIMNDPDRILLKVNGHRYLDPNIKFKDIETYHNVINNLILFETDTNDRIGVTPYRIESQLVLPDYQNPNNPPLFARVHIIAPPVVKAAKVTIAKKPKRQFQIDTIVEKGSMTPQMGAFLKACARGRVTMVLAGIPGSGKTTLLEALSYNFDESDRVIVVEDSPEIKLPLSDVVYLLSTSPRPDQKSSERVTLGWLVAQANRMRPDRIIVGEIRDSEMAEFLTAANSGAEGSMTTLHANSPQETIYKMASLAGSGSNKTQENLLRDIANVVQIIIQTTRIDEKHVITHIEEVSNTLVNNNSGIATNSIFQYDRSTGMWLAHQPSDKLKQFLAQRGVHVDNSWFSNRH